MFKKYIIVQKQIVHQQPKIIHLDLHIVVQKNQLEQLLIQQHHLHRLVVQVCVLELAVLQDGLERNFV